MGRILFEYLLPLILPTAIYALWLAYARRRAAAVGAQQPAWEKGPWFWLALVGVGLCIASIVATAVFGGYRPAAQYTPPAIENGQVVPGQFKDK